MTSFPSGFQNGLQVLKVTLLLLLLVPTSFVRASDQADGEENECRNEIRKFENYIVNSAWTCSSKCSQSNLHLSVVTATASNIESAVGKLEQSCAKSSMSVVYRLVTCMPNFVQADLHQKLDDDCSERKHALERELAASRITCFAELSDRFGNPYTITARGRTVQEIFGLIAAKADHHFLSIRKFSLKEQCVRR